MKATVLLTGSIGFVGGATASRLLTDPRVDRLVLLVRADSQQVAEERMRRSLVRFGVTDFSRAQVVVGDLHSVRLDRGALTHVIHAAACTSFRSTREVHRTNVEGTATIATQLRGAPKLQRFVHVSPAFQCGALEPGAARSLPRGNPRLFEARESLLAVDEDTPRSPEHVVEYTRTKALAEDLVTAMEDLPWLIARPSVVIGHTELGVGPSTSLYWYYRALAEAGVAPFSEQRPRDIVPVDYVAEALVHLLFLESPAHRTFHISAGEASVNTWGEIRQAFGQSRPSREVAQLAADPAWRDFPPAFATALDLVARFAAVPVAWFSNRRLLESGLRVPPHFVDYLPRCMKSSQASLVEMLNDDT